MTKQKVKASIMYVSENNIAKNTTNIKKLEKVNLFSKFRDYKNKYIEFLSIISGLLANLIS